MLSGYSWKIGKCQDRSEQNLLIQSIVRFRIGQKIEHSCSNSVTFFEKI
jgi:hypothetical protein